MAHLDDAFFDGLGAGAEFGFFVDFDDVVEEGIGFVEVAGAEDLQFGHEEVLEVGAGDFFGGDEGVDGVGELLGFLGFGEFFEGGVEFSALIAVGFLGFEAEGVGGVEGDDLIDFGFVIGFDQFWGEGLEAFLDGLGFIEALGGIGFFEGGVAGFADGAEVVEVFIVGFGPAGHVAGFGVGAALSVR